MGKQWKQCQTLFFWVPKSLQMVTAAMKLKDTYSLEEMTSLDSILKSREGPYSQSYGFSSSQVWIWELDYNEGWAPKNWCFWMWCWRRLLRVPWTAKRSNQSILKEINPEYSLEGLMLKLKLNTLDTWCKEPSHWKRPWCWEKLRAGEKGWQWVRWLDGIIDSMDMGLSKPRDIVKDREAWHAAVHGAAESPTQVTAQPQQQQQQQQQQSLTALTV